MNWRRGLTEALLFLVASAVGIFGLGTGLAGFFGPGRGDIAWLGASAVALMVLAQQMGRVQDHWPRRAATRATSGRSARPVSGAGTPPAGTLPSAGVPATPE